MLLKRRNLLLVLNRLLHFIHPNFRIYASFLMPDKALLRDYRVILF